EFPRDHLGVEPFAELISPSLRMDEPLPRGTAATDVAESVPYRVRAGFHGSEVKSAVSVFFEQSLDLLDGGPHLGRVITPAVLTPTVEDNFDGPRNCSSLPG